MIQFLKQPYPFEYSVKKNLRIIIGATLFVTFFLFLFKPFGLYIFGGLEFFIICLQFGFATGTVMAAYYFLIIPLLPKFFNEENWTVIRHIVWVSALLIGIATANTVLMYIIGLGSLSLKTLFVSLGQVTAIGMIITTVFVCLDYLRHFKSNQKEARDLNLTANQSPSSGTISLFSENNNEQLHLKTTELFYLTSADNYIEIVYASGKKTSQKLLRGTLQRAEEQINHPGIIRCHRSYIVNLQKVIAVDGTAQGYRLDLRGSDKSIPVSRSYKKAVMQFLKNP